MNAQQNINNNACKYKLNYVGKFSCFDTQEMVTAKQKGEEDAEIKYTRNEIIFFYSTKISLKISDKLFFVATHKPRHK